MCWGECGISLFSWRVGLLRDLKVSRPSFVVQGIGKVGIGAGDRDPTVQGNRTYYVCVYAHQCR